MKWMKQQNLIVFISFNSTHEKTKQNKNESFGWNFLFLCCVSHRIRIEIVRCVYRILDSLLLLPIIFWLSVHFQVVTSKNLLILFHEQNCTAFVITFCSWVWVFLHHLLFFAHETFVSMCQDLNHLSECRGKRISSVFLSWFQLNRRKEKRVEWKFTKIAILTIKHVKGKATSSERIFRKLPHLFHIFFFVRKQLKLFSCKNRITQSIIKKKETASKANENWNRCTMQREENC